MKRKKIKKQHEVILKRNPCICPHCNKEIIIKDVTIEQIGQKILIPCCHCKGLIRIKIIGPLLSNFIIEEYNPREGIRIEK